MSNFSALQVKVLRTLEEVEKMRPVWSVMQSNPESDIDFVSFIATIRPEIVRPYVVVVYKGSEPISLLVGRVENSHLEAKIGYTTLWRCRVRRLAIFYGGLMGETSPEVIKLVLQQLLRSLREEKADLLWWNGIPWNTELHQLVTRTPNPLCRDYLARPCEHWILNLPSSLEEFIEQQMGKRSRQWARKSLRKIEKDFQGEVSYGCYSAPHDVGKLLEDVITVAKKTYQWGLGLGFKDTEENRRRFRLEADKGWLRGYVLYLENEPVAFWVSSVYQDTVYLAFTGFDPNFREYEVGSVLFFWMVRDLCRQNMRRMDFGLGASFYKERFCDSKFLETTMSVFTLSFRGVSLNLVRLLTQGPSQLFQSLLVRSGLEQKIKKLWRVYRTPARESVEPS
jgi:hypothetical protein